MKCIILLHTRVRVYIYMVIGTIRYTPTQTHIHTRTHIESTIINMYIMCKNYFNKKCIFCVHTHLYECMYVCMHVVCEHTYIHTYIFY